MQQPKEIEAISTPNSSFDPSWNPSGQMEFVLVHSLFCLKNIQEDRNVTSSGGRHENLSVLFLAIAHSAGRVRHTAMHLCKRPPFHSAIVSGGQNTLQMDHYFFYN